MKIAVVGSGIAGLSCAYRLARNGHVVSLFEANDYFGGHTHTVDVTLDGHRFGVDTGFLVFNHRTYPNLVCLFADLDIDTVPTDMSFSVKMQADASRGRPLEWAGSNLDSVFTQRRNLCNPRFLRMLRDILRFNKQATALARSGTDAGWDMPLGAFLNEHRYSNEFRTWYLLPMAGCIWSCPTARMLAFPVATFIRFCHNHGLLQVANRPQWQTVAGGARRYVEKMLVVIDNKYLNTPVRSVRRTTINGRRQVAIDSSHGVQLYDHAVMACHSDQSLRLLQDLGSAERDVLSAIRYQPNRAVLHTDGDLLPRSRKAWSAWNYQSRGGAEPDVCVHYLINKLQPLPVDIPVIVSLNPIEEPRPASVIAAFDYAHPVFDAGAIAAQKMLGRLQGERNTWFAGAWTGYGFHEDGLKSGLAVARAITDAADARAGVGALAAA